jgi:hypothetical protein
VLEAIANQNKVVSLDQLCVCIFKPDYLIGTIFTMAKKINQATHDDCEKWKHDAMLAARKDLFAANDAAVGLNTDKAQAGLLLSTKLKDFLVEWHPERVNVYQNTVMKLMARVEEGTDAAFKAAAKVTTAPRKSTTALRTSASATKVTLGAFSNQAFPGRLSSFVQTISSIIEMITLTSDNAEARTAAAAVDDHITAVDDHITGTCTSSWVGPPMHTPSTCLQEQRAFTTSPAADTINVEDYDAELAEFDMLRVQSAKELQAAESKLFDACNTSEPWDGANPGDGDSEHQAEMDECLAIMEVDESRRSISQDASAASLPTTRTRKTDALASRLDAAAAVLIDHTGDLTALQRRMAAIKTRTVRLATGQILRKARTKKTPIPTAAGNAVTHNRTTIIRTLTVLQAELKHLANDLNQQHERIQESVLKHLDCEKEDANPPQRASLQAVRGSGNPGTENLAEFSKGKASLLRTVAEAAVTLLFAGGEIDPAIIQAARSDRMLSDNDVFDEIRNAASVLEEHALEHEIEGCEWAWELERKTAELLGVHGFDALERGPFLKFLAEKTALVHSADWMRFGDSSGSVPCAVTGEMSENESDRPHRAAVPKDELVEVVMTSARAIARENKQPVSMMRNMTRLQQEICQHFKVQNFSDFGLGADMFKIMEGQRNDLCGLLSGTAFKAASVLAALLPVGDVDIAASIADTQGAANFEALECGSMEAIKVLQSATSVDDATSSTAIGIAAVLCPLPLVAPQAPKSRALVLKLLRTSPNLVPLNEWLNWKRAFIEQHGPLRSFCQQVGNEEPDLVFLEAFVGGPIIRVDANPSNEQLERAVRTDSAVDTVFALLSLVKRNRFKDMSHGVLSDIFRKKFQMMDVDHACQFALEILTLIPDWGALRLSLSSLVLSPLTSDLGTGHEMESKLLRAALSNTNDTVKRTHLEVLFSIAASGTTVYRSWSEAYWRAIDSIASSLDAKPDPPSPTKPIEPPGDGKGVALPNSVSLGAVELHGVDYGTVAVAHDDVPLSGPEELATSRAIVGAAAAAPMMDSATEAGCRKVIESVRAEFEVEEGNGGVWANNLSRALDRLAGELYSDKTHFVLELLQNADDNAYMLKAGEVPTITFQRHEQSIIVVNNEVGFNERNVRALCSIADSTKELKEGHIGRKGIGFKVRRPPPPPHSDLKQWIVSFAVSFNSS